MDTSPPPPNIVRTIISPFLHNAFREDGDAGSIEILLRRYGAVHNTGLFLLPLRSFTPAVYEMFTTNLAHVGSWGEREKKMPTVH